MLHLQVPLPTEILLISLCFLLQVYFFYSSLNLSINYMKEELSHFHRTLVLTTGPPLTVGVLFSLFRYD